MIGVVFSNDYARGDVWNEKSDNNYCVSAALCRARLNVNVLDARNGANKHHAARR